MNKEHLLKAKKRSARNTSKKTNYQAKYEAAHKKMFQPTTTLKSGFEGGKNIDYAAKRKATKGKMIISSLD